MTPTQLAKQPASGASYFLRGFSLAFTPGVRRFVIIPLLVNLLLMGTLIGVVLSQLSDWINEWLAYLPDMLSWLSYLLWPLLAIAALVICSYFFSTVANWIAAPFNGLLAEHLEAKLTGKRPPDDGLSDVIKDLPRVFKREWQKLWYYLPKALGLLLLMWIPVVGQTLGPVLWFLFSAWMMGIQYCDYPFDNHRVSFQNMKATLREQKGATMSFGALVMVFTMTPILNLFVMPAAVCGATAMWVDKYRDQLARY
ncbi:sulfate transporter CysZ [Enterovibrio sp. ZSDZ42]|uniref:Sulfate transporter CysZ n=1 Tax=Enterovibrio gelatinilyticus TaxID=2899819 RepID=A0ABT5QYA0_9GAMM|nr:sulfate transporter CysZ [Enterovibrio sp. ZSDZ42]MDD1792506.1 sulfate transporter CysZ [Enterovibrio sp. ZSDZ42]